MCSDVSRPRIHPLDDGPLVLDGCDGECLVRADGSAYDAGGAVALCRCGGSANKPYCDGSHASNGFTSECVSDRRNDHRDDYAAPGIVVHDNRQVCSHAESCIEGAPEVFHKMHRPWITPEASDPDTISSVIERCPSGALSYSRDGVEHRDLDRPSQVLVRPGGPYEATGGIALAVGDDEWGEGVSREHYTLCRCGGSSNKPFCDGTHSKNGFDKVG